MPVIVNSQHLLEKTKDYRLSIQADLNGFSFSVIDDSKREVLYLYSSDFSVVSGESELFAEECAKIITDQSIFKRKFKTVNLIYSTEKYSLIPLKLYQKEKELEELTKLHHIDELEEVNTINIVKSEMVMIYAVSSTLLNLIKKYHPNLIIYPSLYTYLNVLPDLDGYNKLFFQYIGNIVTVVAAEKERIVFCNSFPASNFSSALYFVLLALKQAQFNPELTAVYINGNIKDYEIFDITRYFPKVNYFRNKDIPLGDPVAEMRYSTMFFKL